jgi:hypothetical protein
MGNSKTDILNRPGAGSESCLKSSLELRGIEVVLWSIGHAKQSELDDLGHNIQAA